MKLLYGLEAELDGLELRRARLPAQKTQRAAQVAMCTVSQQGGGCSCLHTLESKFLRLAALPLHHTRCYKTNVWYIVKFKRARERKPGGTKTRDTHLAHATRGARQAIRRDL